MKTQQNTAEWRENISIRLLEISNEIEKFSQSDSGKSLGLCDLHDLKQAEFTAKKSAEYVKWALRGFSLHS